MFAMELTRNAAELLDFVDDRAVDMEGVTLSAAPRTCGAPMPMSALRKRRSAQPSDDKQRPHWPPVDVASVAFD